MNYEEMIVLAACAACMLCGFILGNHGKRRAMKRAALDSMRDVEALNRARVLMDLRDETSCRPSRMLR